MTSWTFRLARAFVASLVLLALASAAAYAADLGHKDGPYVNGSGGISGSKPESKLWWNDGLWWGSLWDDTTQDFYIYKLDPGTDNWIKTASRLDDRKGSRADTLWDGTHLYVASQLQSDTAAAGSNPARLYRFSYNSGSQTYTNDAGGTNAFAIIRTGSKLETLVIAQDLGGTLWATWTQTSGSNRVVYTNHTQGGNDASWTSGVALPVGSAATTSGDDISSIISFKLNGSQNAVGVFWSNQTAKKDYFAYHVDSAADNAWTLETALAASTNNASPADDHLNLKADSTGRVFAVVKNSNDASGKPNIELLVRPAGGGSWSESVVATGTTHTRPIVLLDESSNTVYVYLTGPTPPDTTGVSGGTIFEKTSSMSSISFPAGTGTARIRDDVSPRMNNPSSTKQNLSSATGVVVLASDDSDSSTPAGHRNYWHYKAGAGGGGGAPVANFTSDVTSGAPGVTVNFTDTSSNSPTSWAWNFGDPSSGALNTSTVQNPPHQYLGAGSYTVSLTATNGSGPGSITKTNYIVVTSGGGGGSTLTLPADADTQVKVGSTTNLGSNIQLRTREENPVASATYRSFLRFNVQGLTGTVNTVTLRLWVDTASSNTQTVYNTTSNPNWPESTTNGTNAPAIGGTAYGSSTASPLGTYKDIALLPSSIGGNGLVTFALKSSGTTSAYFSSKEGAHAPQLVITETVVGTAPTANATSATVTEDGSGPVALSGSDPETCELTFVLVTPPTKGTVNFTGQTPATCTAGTPNTDSASVTYTPNPNANGSDSFTYKVNDGSADSAPATASVTITPDNDIPTAGAVNTTASIGTPKVITLSGADVETCELTFTVVTQPTSGTLAGGGTITNQACAGSGPFTDAATVTYTATVGTSDSFTYKVTDGNAADSASATVTITITAPNNVPTANATSATVGEDGSGTMALSGGDIETCDLTFSIVSAPAHGTLGSITPAACLPGSPNTDSASVTYAPAANYNGPDSFTYKVNDGTDESSPATATLTVTSANDTPSAVAKSASTPQNTAKSITLSGSDVDDCELTFAFTQPSHGAVGSLANVGCANGNPNTDSATVTYTPTAGYTGPDSFTYTVTDGTATSPSATVTLTVTSSSQTITVPVAFDAQVNSANVGTNYGNLTPIRTREDSTGANTYRPYFQFNVPAFSGSVSSVKLRLYVTTASTSVTQSVFLVGNGWTETGVNWTTAPALPVSSIGSGVAGTAGAYVEFTLTTPIASNTTYSFALKSSGSTSVYFNSDDSATNKPELVIVTGP
ncbi:MAG: tandem-95 repeat protein [Chloroflexota bacterium]